MLSESLRALIRGFRSLPLDLLFSVSIFTVRSRGHQSQCWAHSRCPKK